MSQFELNKKNETAEGEITWVTHKSIDLFLTNKVDEMKYTPISLVRDCERG